MAKPILAIANFRVSSDEQLLNNSLARQEHSVRKAASELGVEIVRSWAGSVSSKKGLNVDRKDLEEMLIECKRNPNIKYAIFDELDRFMRSMLEIGYFITEFKKLGVQIKFASQPDLKTDTAANTLILMLEAFKAEGSNEERQRKSIAGQTMALKDGRYPFSPKPGYKKGYRTGVQELHDTRGPILRSILVSVATHKITPSMALSEFNESDFTNDHSLYKMDKFRKILTDPFYAGIVEIHKQVDIRNENGLHEPLISKEQHLELIRIMDAKPKNQKGPHKGGNPKYPLSNIVSCDLCRDKKNGRYVGFDHGNGQNPNLVYEKYRCRGCNRYITREELSVKVVNEFKRHPFTGEAINMLIDAIDIVWKQREISSAQEKVTLTAQIQSIKSDVSRQALAAIDPSNETIKQEILDNIEKEKTKVSELEGKLFQLDNKIIDDKDRFLKFAFEFIDNMGSRFLEISQANRLKCKQIVFPAGFYVDANNKVYTPEISPLIRLIPNKKDTLVSQKSHLVRVKRL